MLFLFKPKTDGKTSRQGLDVMPTVWWNIDDIAGI